MPDAPSRPPRMPEVERFVAGEPLIGAVRADKLALLA
jgi:hypothetical protein